MNERKIIGIHRGGAFSERWASAVEAAGAEVRWLDLLQSKPLEQVHGCDGVMWHWAHYPHERRMAALPILRTIEDYLHIPIFPNMPTSWHYDDKIAQSYLLNALEIPCPDTWVFWKKEEALQWAKKTVYPVVAKLSGGASSQNVRLLRNPDEAVRYIRRCFSGSGIIATPPLAKGMKKVPSIAKRGLKRLGASIPYILGNRFPSLPDQQYWMPQKNYALFQEFLPGNEFDTRVTVVGNRAFGYRRFNRANDFRASGSGNFDTNPAEIDRRCIQNAFDFARRLQAQSVAFDFLFRGEVREPVVGEISYCYVDWMVESCPGHWDSKLQWHEGRMWPEQAHVEDFLAGLTPLNPSHS